MASVSVSTVEQLFPELLGTIFEECSFIDPDLPYTLSLVSTTFSTVVRSTPSAWRQLHLQAMEKDDSKSSSKVATWFSLSGTQSVNIHVDVLPSSTPHSGFLLKKAEPPNYGATGALKRFTRRIKNLSISATSECDARAFINAIYEEPTTEDTFALNSLITQVSSTAPPSPFASSIPLPHLPQLRHLKLLNHSIAFLEGRRFDQLQDLSITRPIRFVPFSLLAVLDMLRNAPVLRTLSIESRIRDDTGETDSLIHLPLLTSLSLRTNVVPSILSSLLLPNLLHLRVDDLNGKQAARSRETASALQHLLVRMEMPNEHRVNDGIRELKLLNVDVCLQDDAKMAGAGDASWEWCFARMQALEKLSVTKVDPTPILSILGSPSWTDIVPSDRDTHDETSLTDTSSFPCPKLDSFAITNVLLPANLEWFEAQRPLVRVDLPLEGEPFYPGSLSPTSTVDFLSVYTELLPPPPAPKPRAQPQAIDRGSRHAQRGPWVVLGHQRDET